mgnify:CR=1 FL=1
MLLFAGLDFAPRKYACRSLFQQGLERRDFRADLSAASLKHQRDRRAGVRRNHFRADLSAASLKRKAIFHLYRNPVISALISARPH